MPVGGVGVAGAVWDPCHGEGGARGGAKTHPVAYIIYSRLQFDTYIANAATRPSVRHCVGKQRTGSHAETKQLPDHSLVPLSLSPLLPPVRCTCLKFQACGAIAGIQRGAQRRLLQSRLLARLAERTDTIIGPEQK